MGPLSGETIYSLLYNGDTNGIFIQWWKSCTMRYGNIWWHEIIYDDM